MRVPAGVRLALSNAAGNVAVARAALTGVAEAFGFDPELVSDLKTAVSEACNNVAVHAYPNGHAGPMWVDIDCFANGVRATVADRGRGITRISGDDGHMGLGLAVINALATRSQFSRPAGGGAAVQMWFSRELDSLAPARPADPPTDTTLSPLPAESGPAVVVFCDEELCPAVLGRVLPYMAASAHFSLTGIDAVRRSAARLAEDMADRAEHGWIGTRIVSASRRLEVTVIASPDAAGDVPHFAIDDAAGGDLRMV